MTEYEYADLIATYSSNAGAFFAVYLTVVSGYLITAFVAGPKLSSLQVTILNIGFVVASCMFTFAAFGAGVIRAQYTMKLLELGAESPHAPTTWLFFVFVTLMISGVLASLYFMWNVRHPKTE